MFDNLSDRLGGVFDRLKVHEAFPAKVGTGFAVRKRAKEIRVPLTGGVVADV